MRWERDDAKLERVRDRMADSGLDALVVRAPDNVLYLTNFWGMKGYDACVFPREGEPVLICLEASEEDASRTAWTSDVRYIRGYADDEGVEPVLRHELADAVELGVVARPRHQSPQGRMRGGAGSPRPSCHETTGLRSTPIRSISASITSPGLR